MGSRLCCSGVRRWFRSGLRVRRLGAAEGEAELVGGFGFGAARRGTSTFHRTRNVGFRHGGSGLPKPYGYRSRRCYGGGGGFEPSSQPSGAVKNILKATF